MKITFEDITLRDYELSDVEDEIRWTNEDTDWFYADTPWMTMEKVDPDELYADMKAIMESMSENAIRWRFEIEYENKHIGLLSSSYHYKDLSPIDWNSIDQSKNAKSNNCIRELGIEICEPDYWGKGIGTKALTAFMDYYRSLGEDEFILETWSGNNRMVRCAEKLGFKEFKRTVGAYTVKGKEYDAVIYKISF